MNRYFEVLWKAAHGVKGFSETLIDYILHNGDGGNTEMYDALNAISADHSDGRFTSLDLMKLSGAVDLSDKGITSLTSSYNGKTYYPLDFLLRATSIDLSGNDLIKDIVFKQNGGFLSHLTLPVVESLKMETPRFVYINNPVVSENGKATVTRKVYDADSDTETELGIPYTEVTEIFPNSIKSDGMSLSDVWNVNEIEIADNHSKGLLALVADIAEIQSQERCISPEFPTNPNISGYKIDDGDETNWEEGCTPYVKDITDDVDWDDEDKSVNGIPISKVYRAMYEPNKEETDEDTSKKVSFWKVHSSVILDGKKTIAGYSVENAKDCVYKVLSTNDVPLCVIKALFGDTYESIQNDIAVDVTDGYQCNAQTIEELSRFIIAIFSRINLNSIIGLVGVFVGIDGGIPEWMISYSNLYGIPLSNLIKATEEYGSVIRYALEGKVYMNIPSGNKAFNTGVAATGDEIIIMDCILVSVSQSNCPIMGYYSNSKGKDVGFYDGTSLITVRNCNGWSNLTSYTYPFGSRREIMLYPSKIVIGTYSQSYTYFDSGSGKIGFCGNPAFPVANHANMKFYKGTIKINDSVACLLIPIADNICLDLISYKVIGGSGSGAATLVIEN